jgi:hypothetical protein
MDSSEQIMRNMINMSHIRKPNDKSYIKYHLRKAIDLLKPLYSGNNSTTEYTKLVDSVNTIVYEQNIGGNSVIDVEAYESKVILERYPPIVEISIKRSEFDKKDMLDKIHRFKEEYNLGNRYLWLINRVDAESSVKIHSILNNITLDEHQVYMEKIMESNFFKK